MSLESFIWRARIFGLLPRERITVDIRIVGGDRATFRSQASNIPIFCHLVDSAGVVIVDKVNITSFARARNTIGMAVVLETPENFFSEDWVGEFLVPRAEE